MADEAASIGVKMDTSDVERGIKTLDQLANTGAKTEKALDGVEKSATKTGKGLKSIDGADKGLSSVSKEAPKTDASLKRVGKSAVDVKDAIAAIKTSAASLASVSSQAGSAASNLSSIASPAAAAAKQVSMLASGASGSQAALLKMQEQVTAATQSLAHLSAAMQKTVPVMQSVSVAQASVTAASAKTAEASQAAAKGMHGVKDSAQSMVDASAKSEKGLQRVSSGADIASTAMIQLRNAMALTGVSFGARELLNLADGYTKFTAQIGLATDGALAYSVAMGDVKRIATDAQQGIGELGTLYARITNSTKEMGLSQQKVADITEVVAMSLKASGATAAESSSAMLQLSQAFGSGVLRGEEFNAVNEAAPRLMKALAEGMGVPIGALREMASEGRITSAVMAQALPKALQEVRKEAESMQTIGGAFTVLRNEAMEFIGVASKSSGAVSVITSSVQLLAENLNLATAAAVGFGAVKLSVFMMEAGKRAAENVASTASYVAALNQQRAAAVASAQAEAATTSARLAGLTALQAKVAAEHQAALASAANATSTAARTQALMAASVAELNLSRVTAQQAAASVAATAAQTALNGALTATSVAATAAGRAITILGGPIGAISTLLGIGAAAWMAWGRSAEDASNQAHRGVAATHHQTMDMLDKQIAKHQQRIALLRAGNSEAAKAGDTELASLGKIDAERQKILSKGAKADAADQIALIELDRMRENQLTKISKAAGLRKEAEDLSSVIGTHEWLAIEDDKITKQFIERVEGAARALQSGAYDVDQYRAKIAELNKERHASTAAGKAEAAAARDSAKAGKGVGRIDSALAKSAVSEIQTSLRDLTSSYSVAESIMEARRSSGLLSEQEYYAAKKSFIELNKQAQLSALAEEAAALQSQKLKGAEAIARDQKVAELKAKSAQLAMDASGKLQVLEIQQAAAARQHESALLAAKQAADEYILSIQRASAVEVMGVGRGDRWRQDESGRLGVKDKFAEQRRALANQRAQQELAGTLSPEAVRRYEQSLEQVNNAEREALKVYKDGLAQRAAAESNWLNGANRAFENYAATSANVAEQTASMFSNAFKGMEDALASFAMTGKADFKSLANSIISDLIRIQIRSSMTQALGGGSGGGGGWLGSLLSAFGGGSSFAGGNAAQGIKMNALGGVYDSPSLSAYSNQIHDTPKLFAFAKGGVFGEAGPEAIMPLTRTAGGNLGVRAVGAGGVIVNIHTDQGAQVEQSSRTDSSGREIIDVFIKQAVSAVAGQLGSDSGPIGQAMRARKSMGIS